MIVALPDTSSCEKVLSEEKIEKTSTESVKNIRATILSPKLASNNL